MKEPEFREQEAKIRAQALGLSAPRFEANRELLIAGMNVSYTCESRKNIPGQWERFARHIGRVPGQVDQKAYGVCWNSKPNGDFDYLSGVEVIPGASQSPEFTRTTIPARRYAVFTHEAHISLIAQTIDKIWTNWVPNCGLSVAKAPCFERYTEEYDPKSGFGGTEIWIPLE